MKNNNIKDYKKIYSDKKVKENNIISKKLAWNYTYIVCLWKREEEKVKNNEKTIKISNIFMYNLWISSCRSFFLIACDI